MESGPGKHERPLGRTPPAADDTAGALAGFHPAVAAWFESRFPAPTRVQAQAWPAIRAGEHVLVAAPTGSGKTLAAFLAALDELVRRGLDGTLADETHVVYVSPLKALSNDVERNLQEPLAGIRRELLQRGLRDVEIRTFVRTGDTPARAREAMVRRPPHIVVTTPESLYIMLTSRGGREFLQTARTVIVDEIHAVVGSKRGSHLALSLERLDALAGRPLVRVGLSATQRPIEEVARFLVGTSAAPAPSAAGEPPPPRCRIIDAGHIREVDLAIEVPRSPLEVVMSGEVWEEIYDRLAELIRGHRTTLVFVNTRRLAERVTRHLAERLDPEHVTSHHGSLAREQRLDAEQRLKSGALRALVATSSLELGIDVGDVDLVCQLGATRSIAAFLQRVGRSGHALAATPKGRIFPLSRDELVECAALLDAVRRAELDRLVVPEQPLDILAQQIVACVAAEEWSEDGLFALVCRAWPYRNLTRADFDAVVRMLADGFATHRGRRSAHLHRDGVNHRLRGRRGARLAAITCGGAIPDTADFQVVLEPSGTFIGTLNEDFAIESTAGDVFQLGNSSWRILRIEPGRVRVADARGEPPTLPFWLGEAPARTAELSAAVSRLRAEIATRLDPALDLRPATDWLIGEVGVEPAAALQIAEYLAGARAALGVLPTREVLVLERFFDEAGGMQLVLHAPFGSRLNRAWGLALRKRFCRKFNFELQAAATEDAIVLSLGPTHSFPLDEVFEYLSPETAREVLVQALLAAPMFAVRWRWNTTRALAVLRFRNGRRVPANLLRMQTDDLLTVVFPDQVACAENLAGAREVPDHPLVSQTVRDCLEEAMDIDHLESLLAQIARGEVRFVTRDVTEPSPLAQEILNARPYAFLDDAPLEERRTRAVLARRWLDPASAADLGALDVAAIERVRSEAWPEAAHRDELHDALVLLGYMTEAEGRAGRPGDWSALLCELAAEARAARLWPLGRADPLWVAAERLPQLATVFPGARLDPPIEAPLESRHEQWESSTALVELVRGRMEGLAVVSAAALAESLGLAVTAIDTALLRLESEGFVLRGRFTPAANDTEWCERRLLARVHRYTIQRLRAEIEPVSAADYLRFALEWQHVGAAHRVEGPFGLASVLEALEGFEAAAGAWESEILAARVGDYDPAWLDALCLSGRFVWMRMGPPRTPTRSAAAALGNDAPRPGPVRSTPVVLLQRRNLPVWSAFSAPDGRDAVRISPDARSVEEFLASAGAAFFDDIVAATRLLRTQVESALGELVALGRVTADSFAGLRALLVPSNERRPLGSGPRRRRRAAALGVEEAGRWVSLVRTAQPTESPPPAAESEAVETVARVLLRRYGVVFRKLLERETVVPPWRELLRSFRRLEARGEIRGGRFVDGFSGEQYALPDAIGALRQARRSESRDEMIAVSAADPLNLVGIVTPDGRLPALARNRVLYRGGVPLAVREAGETRLFENLDPAAEWQARNALVRRPDSVRPHAAARRRTA